MSQFHEQTKFFTWLHLDLLVCYTLTVKRKMALTHLAFALLTLAIFEDSAANKTAHNHSSILDPKRRSNIVDEAFLEQKDVLLDMLESKLKEVRDKKKKKALDHKSHIDAVREKCESMLKNVDVKVKINGISAVGEADLKLNYGNSGKGVININSTGISNIGQANMELGVGDSAVFIPGLSNLFIDRSLLDCVKKNSRTSDVTREGNNESTNKIEEGNETSTPVETNADKSTEAAITLTDTPTSSDLLIPTTVSTQGPVDVNLTPNADVVPGGNQTPVGFPGAQSSPQLTPQAIPQGMIPQGIPQAIPQVIPQVVPQAVPQAIPQAIPQAVPQALPQAVPQAVI